MACRCLLPSYGQYGVTILDSHSVYTHINIIVYLDYYFYLHKFLSWSQVALSAFEKDADLDVLDHPILNLIYYMVNQRLFCYFTSTFHTQMQ